jgi:hypothetical protein
MALLLPVLFIFFAALAGSLLLLVLDDDFVKTFKQLYLLPWIFLVAVVVAAPSGYLIYKKQFNLFHPLVFPAWSYFFPAFVLGGLILASGVSQPFFLAYVDDERYNLPLTLVYVALGFGGLTLGFCIPAARKIGEKIKLRLPGWKWENEQITIPALILLGIGLVNIIIGFLYGILGYQKSEFISAYDGLLFMLTHFWIEASFLLWLCIFRTKNLNIIHYLSIVILIIVSLTKSAYQGNRGSLFQICILIGFAYVFSGREVRLKHRIIGGIVLTFAILVGMIYGTTFRNIKQNESQVGIDTYSEYILSTFDKVLEQDLAQSIGDGISSLAERLEAVSSLAVTVSNYEKLKSYEESYGLDNNIWNDLVTFMIPRFIWQDKPIVSDPRKYGDLYFNYSENSFTITPMGDLLRNFGPIGVPLGMIVLGFIIRITYSLLMENQEFSYWRVTLYYMILSSVSYEGFYGTIIPFMFKVMFISMIGIIILRFCIKEKQKIN